MIVDFEHITNCGYVEETGHVHDSKNRLGVLACVSMSETGTTTR